MLQWMGGSRRKVATTRKSTHSRQKQYFEQRKRKQRTSISQCNAEGTKSISCRGGSRSLDILSFANLTTFSQTAQQGCYAQSNETNEAPVATHETKCFHPSSSSNHSPHYDDELYEASRLPNSRHDALPEQSRVTANSDGNILKSSKKVDNRFSKQRIDASCVYNGFHETEIKVPEQPKGTQDKLSILDILNDAETKSNFEGRLTCEDHVAFSAEGLGNIGTHTPIKTPKKTGSTASCLPLRADFCNSSFSKFASILDDLGKYKETGIDAPELFDNMFSVREGYFDGMDTLPMDTCTRSRHHYQPEKDHAIRYAPCAKRRMSKESWMDKKRVSKAVIDDAPFGKSYLGKGNVKDCLFNRSKNPLSPVGEEYGCPMSFCSEDRPIDAQSAEISMRSNVADDSSNESNFLSTSCRERAIVHNNKSSVEDNGSSSKLSPVAVPETNGSEHGAETAETSVLHGEKCSDRPKRRIQTAKDLEQISSNLEHGVCSNVHEGLDDCVIVPSQYENRESGKENFQAEGVNGSSNTGPPPCQVTLQSYVLQLLCVQKILMNSSVENPAQNS